MQQFTARLHVLQDLQRVWEQGSAAVVRAAVAEDIQFSVSEYDVASGECDVASSTESRPRSEPVDVEHKSVPFQVQLHHGYAVAQLAVPDLPADNDNSDTVPDQNDATQLVPFDQNQAGVVETAVSDELEIELAPLDLPDTDASEQATLDQN